MKEFRITGGTPLHGSVRLGGAKNASFKLMIASLLTKGESRLLNFSHIKDVEVTKRIIEKLAVKIYSAGERTLFIHADSIPSSDVDPELGLQSRASSMFLAPLLARTGKASAPLPGGDSIGARPIDRHTKGLEAFGARVWQDGNLVKAEAPNGLHGAEYIFEKVTHTGTETVLMAAVAAKGKSVLKNCAVEPEVDDLISYLRAMGANIRRREPRIIEVEGGIELHPTIHRIMPDRNEAVTYACAAIATKGDIVVENAKAEHLTAFLEKIEEIGAGYEIGEFGIRFYWKGQTRSADIITSPHPGFMTDWQPLWAVVASQAEGESTIHETVSEQRFQYAEFLSQMGVTVRRFQPEVEDPKKLYQWSFSSEHDLGGHALAITGPAKLRSGSFVVPDIRAGANLVLSSMIADGVSTLTGVDHIERGYEKLPERLLSMGANIEILER